MKLRTKTFVVICIVCTVFFVLLTSILHIFIMQGYLDLEEKIVTDHVNRVSNQLTYELNSLTAIGYDWSSWDDTYFFVQDKNDLFIQTNLQYFIFEDIKVNCMLFYNRSGSLVFSKAYNFSNETEFSLPITLYSFIDGNKAFLLEHPTSEYSLSGIVVYDQKEIPLLLSFTPILKSNQQGPIQGTLIVGRFLDEIQLRNLEEVTQLTLSIHPLSEHSSMLLPDSTMRFVDENIFIREINSTYIAGYHPIEDIFGNPVLIVEVGSDREIFNQGMNTLQNLFIALFISTIFLLILTTLIMEKFVTSRLMNLNKTVAKIQNFEDLSKSITMKGNDEISLLADNINTMLGSLQSIWSMKDSAESSLQKKIEELERFKTLTIDREIKMIELKKQIQAFKKNDRGDEVG